ncbi:DUF7146 domain-containing protein [Roseovarius sp. C03]|uniref:DUF7146 domain-containing protein n=1 Tax=Roseovarius sp. C03 TaxID=3449222 RepID=UPI003EDC0B57
MGFDPDPRVDLARGLTMREICDRLPLDHMRREGRELVGACPKCGGWEKRDANRFAISVDRGVWHCRKCPAGGDGIALVQHVLGCDFPGALDHLAGKRVEISPAELERRRRAAEESRRRQEAEAERYRRRAIADAVTIWRSSVPAEGSPVIAYLARRGLRLPVPPKALRFKPDHPYVRKLGGRRVTLHRGPCMISAVQGPDDRLRAVHQTWIDLDRESGKAEIRDPDGKAYPAKMVRGSKKGGAIRLGGGGAPVMVMGEGIETTLSARILAPYEGASYWAGVDLGNMAGTMTPGGGRGPSGEPDLSDGRAFVPPAWVRRLVLIQDGDSDPDATRAALLSGIRRAQHHIPGLKGEIVHPGAGRDLNDALRESNQ